MPNLKPRAIAVIRAMIEHVKNEPNTLYQTVFPCAPMGEVHRGGRRRQQTR